MIGRILLKTIRDINFMTKYGFCPKCGEDYLIIYETIRKKDLEEGYKSVCMKCLNCKYEQLFLRYKRDADF